MDVATKKVTRLTRGGRPGSGPVYSDVSVSRSGRRHAFVFGNDLFVSGKTPHRARVRLERRVLVARMSPDGRQVAFIQLLLEDPSFVSYLFTIGATKSSAKESVARTTLATGWLGDRLMRDDREQAGDSQKICLLASNDDFECERDAAIDPSRDLFDPEGSPNGRFVVATAVEPGPEERRIQGRIALFSAADGTLVRYLTSGSIDSGASFSPDGKRVVFERGKRLHTVALAGGRTPRLVRRGISPAWSR